MQSRELGILGTSGAHQDHDARDGEAWRGLVRRNRPLPSSEKTSSTAALRVIWGRFLLQAEQVEGGGLDGGHGEARGGLCRRRRPRSERARVCEIGEKEEQEQGGLRPCIYRVKDDRRRSRCPQCRPGRGSIVAVSTSRASRDGDEDDDVFSSISTRRGTWACWAVKCRWAMGCCWAEMVGFSTGCTTR